MRISRHPALQSVVLPPRGLTCRGMGVLQVEEPKRSKVGNWPACLVGTVSFGTPLPMASFAQNASQSAANKSVFQAECLGAAVLEVLKPAPQRPVYVRDDLRHAVSGGSFGLRPNRISEFLEAFAARPALASLEVIAKKIKAVLAFIDQPRLGRVQR
jgi:hypothetical protein